MTTVARFIVTENGRKQKLKILANKIEGVTLGDEDEGEGQVAADGRIRVVPSWHCLTLLISTRLSISPEWLDSACEQAQSQSSNSCAGPAADLQLSHQRLNVIAHCGWCQVEAPCNFAVA